MAFQKICPCSISQELAVTTEAEAGVMGLQVQDAWNHQKWEEAKTRFCPGASKEDAALLTPGLWPPEPRRHLVVS